MTTTSKFCWEPPGRWRDCSSRCSLLHFGAERNAAAAATEAEVAVAGEIVLTGGARRTAALEVRVVLEGQVDDVDAVEGRLLLAGDDGGDPSPLGGVGSEPNVSA